MPISADLAIIWITLWCIAAAVIGVKYKRDAAFDPRPEVTPGLAV